MDSLSDGCRLCLDPFAECFTTIENPQLKDQMDKVFRFTIEPKQGCCSGVCQSCSFAISEFYQYSEKVRKNQEVLYGKVTNCDPIVDSKISFESVNTEVFIKSELQEAAEDACEPMDEVLAEEVPILDSKITVENLNLETFKDSVIPESTKNASEPTEKVSGKEETSSGDDEPNEPSSKKSQTKQERHKEDLLFNKHCRMICDLCGMSAETFTALHYHFKKEHKRNGYVVCCNRKLNRRYAIRLHIDWHANPDLFRCKVCDKKHNTRDNLNSHMLRMHSNDDNDSFDHCPQSSVQKSALDQHIEWHENSNTKQMLSETVEDGCKLQATVSEVEEPILDSVITIENVKVETLTDAGPPETIDGALNSEITIENVKIETHNDFEISETTENDCEPEKEASEEYGIPCSEDNESYELSSKQSRTKRKRRRGKTDKPSLTEERHKEDQIFNKHFRMVCDLCGTSEANFTGIVRHFWKEHNRHGYVVCCNQKLFKRFNMRDHLEFHANPDVFRCKVCGINLKNKSTLTNHMFLKHSTAGQFKCDLCPQSFAEESDLAFHIKRHAKVKCPKCHKTFARNNSLGRHVADCGRFACDICGKEFTSKRLFDRHMKLHARNAQEPASPDGQGGAKQSSGYALVQLHRGIRVQRFQCKKCHCWLKDQQSLRNHMNLVHIESNREFQCDICLQNYPHAHSLYKHKQVTHGEPKYECEFCSKIFKAKRSLQCHQRTSHTGEVKSGAR